MTTEEYSDEILMAYSDGELAPDEAARIAAKAESDPDIAARISVFRRTGEVLSMAAAERNRMAPPAESHARIRAQLARSSGKAGQVVDLQARRNRPRRSAIWSGAIAASIALAIGIGGGYWLGQQPGSGSTGPVQVTQLDPALAEKLSSLPSGETASIPGEVSITPVASFELASGEFCREYELIGTGGSRTVSVACNEAGNWKLRFAMDAGAVSGGEYVPASSLEILDAYLSSSGASAPMSEESERAALGSLGR